MEETVSNVEVKPANKEKINKLWRIAGLLGAVTAIEFLIAFTIPAGAIKIILFVVLTLVKAFYIVAEFMHLGHEVKGLIWSIVLPVIFIVWLILALIMQGGALSVGIY
jgi:cytochrome c oxidase subunit IV